jgi:hypothetical protein
MRTCRCAIIGLVVAVTVTACDSRQDRAEGALEAGALTDRSAPAVLMPVDHSHVTGAVDADRDGETVRIRVTLEGLRPGGTYVASAHAGRCAADGPERALLGTLTGDDDGAGDKEFRAATDEIDLTSDWSVQILAEDGEILACADVAVLQPGRQ